MVNSGVVFKFKAQELYADKLIHECGREAYRNNTYCVRRVLKGRLEN